MKKVEAIEIERQQEYCQKIKEQNNGKIQFYTILTMGCQLNENDSEKLSGILETMGYTETDNIEKSDIIVFNTCCIRENAEDRLFGKLGEAKKIKEKNGTIIALGGCMMQEQHILKKLQRSYPFVDVIFGTHTIYKFPENLYKAIQQNKRMEEIWQIDGEIVEGLPIKRKDTIKASVTIMNGCNNFCTYCIVPYVRGRERSRDPEDILSEINQLSTKGYKEITLLGQNVNSYKGNGKKDVWKFSDLLRKVNEIDGIQRIRFISPHPKDFTDDVIEAIYDCDKVCKIIHLPLQSGSTRILKAMNRNYSKEQYIELVNKMKQRIPGIVFSTDIIVGFPGETEEDFKDTLSIVKEVKFEQVYMFLYSRRIGTLADKMENQVPEEQKHERFERLKKLVENQIPENNEKYVGTLQNVLIEGVSKNNESRLTGRTETNKVVVLEGKKEEIGSILPIRIISEHMWYLKGKIENKERN